MKIEKKQPERKMKEKTLTPLRKKSSRRDKSQKEAVL